ncbi:MAG TPA: hypothetical protein PKL48_00995 [Thermodesulfobacteriota bacterium]|nr:hypothetical protein [Thermodesulfobacteriota bacterium]
MKPYRCKTRDIRLPVKGIAFSYMVCILDRLGASERADNEMCDFGDGSFGAGGHVEYAPATGGYYLFDDSCDIGCMNEVTSFFAGTIDSNGAFLRITDAAADIIDNLPTQPFPVGGKDAEHGARHVIVL